MNELQKLMQVFGIGEALHDLQERPALYFSLFTLGNILYCSDQTQIGASQVVFRVTQIGQPAYFTIWADDAKLFCKQALLQHGFFGGVHDVPNILSMDQIGERLERSTKLIFLHTCDLEKLRRPENLIGLKIPFPNAHLCPRERQNQPVLTLT